MKFRLLYTSLLASVVLFAGCESDEDPIQGNQADAAELRATAQAGQWRITYFFDTDSEETADYDGYVFTFSADGAVMAEKGEIAISGTWSITEDSDDSFDDSPDESDDVDFNLFFSTPPDFEELSDDWDILEYSDTLIKLTDVSGGNGGTDFLTFEKIQ